MRRRASCLKLLGCELVDMKRCRDNSFCCGAGGGRIWIPDPVGAEKPAQNRMREAAAIPGLEVYVVSCPKDLTMFEDALKTTGNEGKFVVKELIELVREAVPARAHRGGARMKILVAVKQVAALDEDFEIRADGARCGRGISDPRPERVGRLTRSRRRSRSRKPPRDPVEVVAVSVAPEEADEALRKCLAKGADRAIRVWDEALQGSDPIAIARILAAVAKAESPDMLFAGVQSSDQTFASTGIATAAFLGWPHAAVVSSLELLAGREERRVPPRARGRTAARGRDSMPRRAHHPARHQHPALCLAPQHQAGRREAHRGQGPRRSRPVAPATSARPAPTRASGACTFPTRAARSSSRATPRAQARRLAEIIREFKGDAA